MTNIRFCGECGVGTLYVSWIDDEEHCANCKCERFLGRRAKTKAIPSAGLHSPTATSCNSR